MSWQWSMPGLLVVLGEFHAMPVKIKIVSAKPSRVHVTVRRPSWQQFLQY